MDIIVKRISQYPDVLGNQRLITELAVSDSDEDDSLTVSERSLFLVDLNRNIEMRMFEWDAFVLGISYRQGRLSIGKLR